MLNFQLLKNDSNQQGNGSQMAVKAASSKSPFVAKVWQFVNLLVSFSACASWSLSVCLKWNWMTFIDKLLQVLGSDDLLWTNFSSLWPILASFGKLLPEPIVVPSHSKIGWLWPAPTRVGKTRAAWFNLVYPVPWAPWAVHRFVHLSGKR